MKKNFLEMYKNLISTPSISGLTGQINQSNLSIVNLLANWLNDLGFDCQINPLKTEKDKYNLIAKRGSGSGGLMLAGHTDTVSYDEHLWSTDPFKLIEKDNKLFGLGSIDMKGFFAFIIQSINKIDQENKSQKQPLIILATADEETTMAGAREIAKDSNLKPKFCIIGEPTNMKPIYMHKGHLSVALKVIGKSGHSSEPGKGLNAIEVMHKVIANLIQLKMDLAEKYNNPHFCVPQPTLNFGHIHGGDNANRICGCCELHMDIRPIPGLSIKELECLIFNAIKPINNQYPNSVRVINLHEPIPAFTGHADSELVLLSEKLSGNKSQSVNYCTEAPFLATLGCETIVMGPGSIEQAHQANEFLDMAMIKPTLNILEKMIYQICY
ncbi:acetylornithine deacetylase [Paraphotobacterium marinum]|uniref:Acetylornithine deacetylase n=1 Tax=Paraphotobacterium marinum TaxID=1755811 RepID=A0A220VFV0_9GAMM|nr:acetylornithine deacetylase [Paraphotobacterium marinum]ASK79062.1 acetylornithine deacetylase [Paraphotobacterium marinum]